MIGTFSPKHIAYYSSALALDPPRVEEGILRYQDDHPGFQLRSFRFDSAIAETEHNLEQLNQMPLPWGDWIPVGVIAQVGVTLNLPEWLTRGGQPLVITGADWAGRWPSVYTSPDSIAALAIDHFLGLGFRHFAFVGLDQPSLRLRWEAFARQLAAKGHHAVLCELETNPLSGLAEAVERASHETRLRQILRTASKPLAILTPAERIGEIVCSACQQLGLMIPSEVAVIGTGNGPAARTCLPPLTSIHTPAEEAGYQAMALLDRLLRDGGSPAIPTIEVPATRLVVRASTQTVVDNHQQVEYLRRLIHEQACRGITLDQIAAPLPVSHSTLHRQFAAAFGCTPGEELLSVRLEKAKELLRAGQPLKTVAMAVGYGTASSFIRFFRKQTGITPEVFRNTSGG